MSKLIIAVALLAAWQSGSPSDPVGVGLVSPELSAATVTAAGDVVRVDAVGPRTLRVRRLAGDGWQQHDLSLDVLPEDARLVQLCVAPYIEGIALGLALERASGGHEYRYLLTPGDVLSGTVRSPDLDDAQPSGSQRWTFPSWTCSPPLFESEGSPWRVVSIRQPGPGDEVELGFRRGPLTGARDRSQGPHIEERIFHDVCAGLPTLSPGKSALTEVVTLQYIDTR